MLYCGIEEDTQVIGKFLALQLFTKRYTLYYSAEEDTLCYGAGEHAQVVGKFLALQSFAKGYTLYYGVVGTQVVGSKLLRQGYTPTLSH